jgi:putative redox protein
MLTNGRHRWVADVPKTLGSEDTAPDPHDLLDSALAACTVLTLELYLKRKPDWKVDRIQCRVERLSETRADDGKVDYQLRRVVKVEGDLTADQEGRLIEIANKCPIHRLLEGRTHIETALDLS